MGMTWDASDTGKRSMSRPNRQPPEREPADPASDNGTVPLWERSVTLEYVGLLWLAHAAFGGFFWGWVSIQDARALPIAGACVWLALGLLDVIPPKGINACVTLAFLIAVAWLAPSVVGSERPVLNHGPFRFEIYLVMLSTVLLFDLMKHVWERREQRT